MILLLLLSACGGPENNITLALDSQWSTQLPMLVKDYQDGIIFQPKEIADSAIANVYALGYSGGPSNMVYTSALPASSTKTTHNSSQIVCTKKDQAGKTQVYKDDKCL